ncbi:MAG: hypothetical protein WCK76_07470 [Elusimicrobiota bacterium]
MENKTPSTIVKPSKFSLAPRRGGYYEVSDIMMLAPFKAADEDLKNLEDIDLLYRALCAILYNFVPCSGHPGGSISSGRIAQALLFSTMDYDFFNPDRKENDVISYAAGHKALGLYALWALRNELVLAAGAAGMPADKFQLRLEDLLGFRRNPGTQSPLFAKLGAKALDGHPTPLTPFVPLATGASGVGLGSAVGLAFAAADTYGPGCPRVNILEGEGGLTPGRAAEALASAATSQLSNVLMHIDWNQASIDSENVCPENSKPGDYVQWTPAELAYVNDWNVIYVANGHDFFQILTAQQFAYSGIDNPQPTAIVYRTVKGWRYGIEGRASHGAGHEFCSEGYYAALAEFEARFGLRVPRHSGPRTPESVEACFYETLLRVRKAVEDTPAAAKFALRKLDEAGARLAAAGRTRLPGAPDPEKAFSLDPAAPPRELELKPGREVKMGETLAFALNHVNKMTGGAVVAASADLYSSTGVSRVGEGFGEGFYNFSSNPRARLYSAGGICEDAMGAIMSGASAFGSHIGVTASYASFLAPLEHIPARLHAIGQQARRAFCGAPANPFIMINAHCGLQTGEDGPTHSDPQPLQLLEGNFPPGSLITLTPWDPQEIWPLLAASLGRRPAVIAPFIPRPPLKIADRAALGLVPAEAAAQGLYQLQVPAHRRGRPRGTVVLQGSGVAGIFLSEVLPRLREAGLNLNVFYVASRELFERLGEEEKKKLYPERLAQEAMGITDFTLPTMYYWVRSGAGLARTLHPFRNGRYPSSGKAGDVMKEAGLDGAAQLKAVIEYAETVAAGK